MTGRRDRSGPGAGVVMGAALVAVICCAMPALAGAGALGVIGTALHNPAIVLAGGLALLGAVGPCCSGAGEAPTGKDTDHER